MFETIKGLILGLIGSKKVIVLISGLIVTALAKYKLNLDPLMIEGMLGSIMAYLLGQGIADHGKGAEEVKAIAAATSMTTTDKVDAIKAV